MNKNEEVELKNLTQTGKHRQDIPVRISPPKGDLGTFFARIFFIVFVCFIIFALVDDYLNPPVVKKSYHVPLTEKQIQAFENECGSDGSRCGYDDSEPWDNFRGR